MTIIITALTQRLIVQASDRRLTRPDGSLFDDTANKALFFCGRVSVAFTGQAFIGKEPTTKWLRDQMARFASAGIESALEHVQREVKRVLRANRLEDHPLAVVACGWATFKGGPPRPFIARISNFDYGPDGVPRVRAFSLAVNSLGEDKIAFIALDGVPLREEDLQWLFHRISKCVARQTGPNPIARLLGTIVLGVGRALDWRRDKVGGGAIIQSLCRESSLSEASGGPLQVFYPIADRCTSFVYSTPDGRLAPVHEHLLACSNISAFGAGPAGTFFPVSGPGEGERR
jgi:hypothetical protein